VAAVKDHHSRAGQSYVALFSSIYALQGVVLAYFVNYNLLYMTAGGVSKGNAADIQSLVLVPFILKFLGGPLSDRINLMGWGHRKPYIILGVLTQSCGLVGLSLVHPARFPLAFASLAILTVCGLALYDTCCDGLVIDVTPSCDRARVQGLLVASRAAAAMVCTLGFGLLLQATGNGPGRAAPVLWTCAALGVVPLILASIVPEPERAADAESFQWRALGVLVQPKALCLIAFGAIYALVGYGVEINLSPFYEQDLQFREGTLGALGSARYIGRIAGAALMPVASARMGRRWVLGIGLLALAVTTAEQAWISGPVQAGTAGAAFGAANGWMDAVFYVLAMEASDPRMAASTYALFMAVTNVSVAGGSLFARLESALTTTAGSGYRAAFLITSAFVLLAWPLLWPLGRPPSNPGTAK
jgi:PAT family beta-lactamase induction signal transducer AmpG